MRNHNRTPLQKTAIDRAIDQAVQRVYDAYGSDLGRFFADVKKAQEACETREESNPQTGTGTAGMRSKSDKTRS